MSFLGEAEATSTAPEQAIEPAETEEPTETTEPSAPAEIVEEVCGTELVDETNDVATVQRLLILAGQDPGPVDGFLGPKTFSALDVFVDGAGWDTSMQTAIDRLNEHLCALAQPSTSSDGS